MNRVWEESRQSEGSLLVLLALADNADDEGVCWPSQETIAHKARLSERQVRRILGKLIAENELAIIRGGLGRGNRATYRVITKADILSPFKNGKADIGDTQKRTLATPPIIEESSLEPSLGLVPELAESKADQIYRAYPRHIAKPKSVIAINKALKKIDFGTLLARTTAYAETQAGADPQFIPHPATWFNQERFNDDPLTWRQKMNGSSTPRKRENIGVLIQTL